MNNIHSDSPAIMADGRSYSNWQPGAVLNENIRKREHIKTNWDYRIYIQKNADSIIEYDRLRACEESGCPFYPVKNIPYHSSDLKDIYLSRQELQNRIIPHIPQSKLFN